MATVKRLVREYVRAYNDGDWRVAHEKYADLCHIAYGSGAVTDEAALAAQEAIDSLDRDGYLQGY